MKNSLIFMNMLVISVSQPAPNLSASSLGSVSKVCPDWTKVSHLGLHHPFTWTISPGLSPESPPQGLLHLCKVCYPCNRQMEHLKQSIKLCPASSQFIQHKHPHSPGQGSPDPAYQALPVLFPSFSIYVFILLNNREDPLYIENISSIRSHWCFSI